MFNKISLNQISLIIFVIVFISLVFGKEYFSFNDLYLVAIIYTIKDILTQIIAIVFDKRREENV